MSQICSNNGLLGIRVTAVDGLKSGRNNDGDSYHTAENGNRDYGQKNDIKNRYGIV